MALFVFANYFGIKILFQAELNLSYKQRSIILAPHISDKQDKLLKALWAGMKNRVDHEEINKKLDNLARDHGITLPDPLLKQYCYDY